MPRGQKGKMVGCEAVHLAMPCGRQFIGFKNKIDLMSRLHKKGCAECAVSKTGAYMTSFGAPAAKGETKDQVLKQCNVE